jgi:hypothetical protein
MNVNHTDREILATFTKLKDNYDSFPLAGLGENEFITISLNCISNAELYCRSTIVDEDISAMLPWYTMIGRVSQVLGVQTSGTSEFYVPDLTQSILSERAWFCQTTSPGHLDGYVPKDMDPQVLAYLLMLKDLVTRSSVYQVDHDTVAQVQKACDYLGVTMYDTVTPTILRSQSTTGQFYSSLADQVLRDVLYTTRSKSLHVATKYAPYPLDLVHWAHGVQPRYSARI